MNIGLFHCSSLPVQIRPRRKSAAKTGEKNIQHSSTGWKISKTEREKIFSRILAKSCKFFKYIWADFWNMHAKKCASMSYSERLAIVCRSYCYQRLWHNQHSHSGTKRAKHPFHHHPGTNVIINTIVTDTVIIVIIIIVDQLLAGAMRCKNNIGVIINISYGRH